jgi:hypothetical protein
MLRPGAPDNGIAAFQHAEPGETNDSSSPGTPDRQMKDQSNDLEEDDVDKTTEGGSGGDVPNGSGDFEDPQGDDLGQSPTMLDFVPSLNNGAYKFTETDGSRVERSTKRLPSLQSPTAN